MNIEAEYDNSAFTQNELDFDDHPICDEFPPVIVPKGWDYV